MVGVGRRIRDSRIAAFVERAPVAKLLLLLQLYLPYKRHYAHRRAHYRIDLSSGEFQSVSSLDVCCCHSLLNPTYSNPPWRTVCRHQPDHPYELVPSNRSTSSILSFISSSSWTTFGHSKKFLLWQSRLGNIQQRPLIKERRQTRPLPPTTRPSLIPLRIPRRPFHISLTAFDERWITVAMAEWTCRTDAV